MNGLVFEAPGRVFAKHVFRFTRLCRYPAHWNIHQLIWQPLPQQAHISGGRRPVALHHHQRFIPGGHFYHFVDLVSIRDITLIDIHMPFSPIDGIETLKRIKNIDKNAICVMVTRIDQKDKIKAAKDLGALHYIPKPFTMSELDEAVNEAADIIKKGKK